MIMLVEVTCALFFGGCDRFLLTIKLHGLTSSTALCTRAQPTLRRRDAPSEDMEEALVGAAAPRRMLTLAECSCSTKVTVLTILSWTIAQRRSIVALLCES